MGRKKSAETVDGEVIAHVATPHKSAKTNLHNLSSVRRELASVYRDARNGKIATQEATRLGYLLSLLSRMLMHEQLETRIEILEKMLSEQGEKQ